MTSDAFNNEIDRQLQQRDEAVEARTFKDGQKETVEHNCTRCGADITGSAYSRCLGCIAAIDAGGNPNLDDARRAADAPAEEDPIAAARARRRAQESEEEGDPIEDARRVVRGVHTVGVILKCQCGRTVVNESSQAVGAALSGAMLQTQCACGMRVESVAAPSMPKPTMARVNDGPNRQQRRAAAAARKRNGGA